MFSFVFIFLVTYYFLVSFQCVQLLVALAKKIKCLLFIYFIIFIIPLLEPCGVLPCLKTPWIFNLAEMSSKPSLGFMLLCPFSEFIIVFYNHLILLSLSFAPFIITQNLLVVIIAPFDVKLNILFAWKV